MKQSAAKTLGVAALGAAFAATGAGAANAAPAVPDATQALGTVTQGLPAENVTKALPGAGEAVAQAQPALTTSVAAAQPVVENALADGPTAPVAGLLGGLPVGKVLPGGSGTGVCVSRRLPGRLRRLPLGGEQDPQRDVEQELRARQQARDDEDHPHRGGGGAEAPCQRGTHSADHAAVGGAGKAGHFALLLIGRSPTGAPHSRPTRRYTRPWWALAVGRCGLVGCPSDDNLSLIHI